MTPAETLRVFEQAPFIALLGLRLDSAANGECRTSLALAYVERGIVADAPALTVEVIGETRAARLLADPAYDPKGLRLRS